MKVYLLYYLTTGCKLYRRSSLAAGYRQANSRGRDRRSSCTRIRATYVARLSDAFFPLLRIGIDLNMQTPDRQTGKQAGKQIRFQHLASKTYAWNEEEGSRWRNVKLKGSRVQNAVEKN